MTRQSFDGDFQVAWDSTSLKALATCPRYYYYSIVLGWRPKTPSPHLAFGIYFHYALELMDHLRLQHKLTDEDLRHILRETMKAAGSRNEETGEWEPWRSPHNSKNLESLVRSIIYYFEQFKEDTMETVVLANGRPAVELGFRFELPVPGLQVQYSGHLDRVVDFAGGRYVMDRKTTGSTLDDRFYAQFTPDIQMPGYTLAGKIAYNVDMRGVIIDGASIGVGFTRFGRRPISYTQEQLEEWLTNTSMSIKLAAQFAEMNYWPMNTTACGNYGGCQFQGICSKSKAVRESFLRTSFYIDQWDPLKPKGVND